MSKNSNASNAKFVKLCAFVALILSAGLFIFGGLFAGSLIGRILNLIAKLALLVAIAVPAYQYSTSLKKGWKIVFWIALIVYIAGCIFGVLDIKIF